MFVYTPKPDKNLHTEMYMYNYRHTEMCAHNYGHKYIVVDSKIQRGTNTYRNLHSNPCEKGFNRHIH